MADGVNEEVLDDLVDDNSDKEHDDDLHDKIKELFDEDYKHLEEKKETETEENTEEGSEDLTSDASESDDETSEESSEDSYVEVPLGVYKVAREQGIDDATAAKMYNDAPEMFDAMLAKESDGDKKKDTESEDVEGIEKVTLTDKQLKALKDAGLAEAIESVVGKVNTAIDKVDGVSKSIDESKVESQKIAVREQYDVAMSTMDKWEDEIKGLGKSKELPVIKVGPRKGCLDMKDPRVKLRCELYDNAGMFADSKKISFDRGLELAKALYAGQHPELTQSKVVSDLNARRKSFTVRPSGKKTVPKEQDFDQQQIGKIAEILKKAK